jgi:transcription termination factor NusB
MDEVYINSMRDTVDKITVDATSGFENISTKFDELLKGVDSEWGNTLKVIFSNATDASKDAQDNIQIYSKLLEDATDPDEAKRYYDVVQENIQKITEAIGKLTYSIKSLEYEANVAAAKENIKDTAKGATEIDDVVNGAMVAGPMWALAAIISQVAGVFSQIENVGKVLNPFTTILERVAAILEPLLNELFAPFVIVLESV